MPIKEITMFLNCVGINVLIYCFENKMYGRRFRKAIHYGIVAGCIFLSCFVNILEIPVLNALWNLAVIMVTTACFFDTDGCVSRCEVCYGDTHRAFRGSCPLGRFWWCNFCFWAGLALIDFITTKVLGIFVNGRINNWMYRDLFFFISMIPILIFDIIFYNILTERLKKNRMAGAKLHENLFIFFFCLLEMAVFLYMMLMDASLKNFQITILLFGMMFLALMIYQLYMNKMMASYYALLRKEEKERVSHELNNMYDKRLEEKEQLYRKMEHDVNKHLNTITQLLHNDEAALAGEYVEELKKNITKLKGPFTFSNKVLQMIINESFYKCKEYDIELTVHIEDLDLSFMENYDLTTLLSNLMENAMEACRGLPDEKRFIVMRLYEYADYLNIYMENGTMNRLKITNGSITSTKGHHLAVGLQNVQDVIRKYGGNLKIEKEDTFIVKISIPVEKV